MKPFASELSCHVINDKHNIDFDNIKILSIEPNEKKRLFLEMWHIQRNLKYTLNKRTDIEATYTLILCQEIIENINVRKMF